jgi:predicted Fe-S protein YdhL (DUF1289 family)
VITPCISVCQMDPSTQTCKGCNRTAQEIREWMRYDDEKRMEIMRRLGYGVRMSREERLRRYDRG